MLKSEKETVVQEITDILKNAKGVFITDFKGLNVEKMSELRNKCRQSSVEYRVVKNTLARIATKQAGFEEMEAYFRGPSAIAYSFDDPVAPIRIVTEFAKKTEKPEVRVSLFEGAFYGPDRVKEIASLPPKEELIARLVSGFNIPIQEFTGCLSALLQKLGRRKNNG
jgi:large subunit ribosomal protein L10